MRFINEETEARKFRGWSTLAQSVQGKAWLLILDLSTRLSDGESGASEEPASLPQLLLPDPGLPA